ncbi:topoisomerase DNA-binding C4 zinc finger domain-containing protein [Sporolactobacillus terrae]|uniref:topoisomerase DNA-binding C4 zinc finger domain-containing protein n=1 Tax=Sporolactobacillus terrae TaxID=269673 RepID=UPI00111A1336|nr:topoisomerase DNA-binding C4 zinc finger domain-containing protein [Sporolactobacillus terrae]
MESAIQKQIKEDKEEHQMIPNTNTALDEQTKEVEKVCPRCGKPMVQRVAKRGTRSGEHFWGCSNFPKCRYMEKQHVVE